MKIRRFSRARRRMIAILFDAQLVDKQNRSPQQPLRHLQTPTAPEQSIEQPDLHCAIVHEPVPEQSTRQLPPPQVKVVAPVPLPSTTHFPSGQSKLHAPVPSHENSQPAPTHFLWQTPIPSHRQGDPGLHSSAVCPAPGALPP